MKRGESRPTQAIPARSVVKVNAWAATAGGTSTQGGGSCASLPHQDLTGYLTALAGPCPQPGASDKTSPGSHKFSSRYAVPRPGRISPQLRKVPGTCPLRPLNQTSAKPRWLAESPGRPFLFGRSPFNPSSQADGNLRVRARPRNLHPDLFACPASYINTLLAS